MTTNAVIQIKDGDVFVDFMSIRDVTKDKARAKLSKVRKDFPEDGFRLRFEDWDTYEKDVILE